MNGTCPLTGEAAEVARTAESTIVEHPRLGRYSVEASALAPLARAAGAGERMASWIAESRALGIRVPVLTDGHVRLFERLPRLDAAVSEWRERRGSMRDADDARLRKKLRLEWNYNTNRIEGNTLTYHETELLLVFGRASGGRPMRHYEEMKAHDAAIEHVRHLARAERVLGEGDVRDLNAILLKEPFWHVARTPDGQRTRKRIVPGTYKTQPNHVRTAAGELHRFAEPEETPAEMERWTREFRLGLERRGIPLPLFLAESHWSFLRIHPFDDGNGRTARLLANYVLLRLGLPPMVIETADRDRYIGALQHADAGRTDPLARFMLENVMRSLDLGIRAAKGKSLREADDVVKEIAVFVQRRKGGTPDAFDPELLDRVARQWILPELKRLDRAFGPLDDLFGGRNSADYWSSPRTAPSSPLPNLVENWEEARRTLAAELVRITDEDSVNLRRVFNFLGYRGSGSPSFSVKLSVVWKMGKEETAFAAKLDGEPIESAIRSVRHPDLDAMDLETDSAVDVLGEAVMAEIERRSERA